ncbi:MAG: choice-of-anchor tandem repeat GloVer-containing protein [Candidatus Cybelea sp.]
MMTRVLNGYAVCIYAATAVLAGCAGSQWPISAPSSSLARSNINAALGHVGKPRHYQVLYSFGSSPDGSVPEGNLIDVGGTLYGTTYYGGSRNFYGTVFSITTGGAEKVLHSFGRRPDGENPLAGLIDVNGTLYGTAFVGGKGCNCGTVYSINTSGKEKLTYDFGQIPDGEDPRATLVELNGTLYGTTWQGGVSSCPEQSCGTVFSVTPGGTEKVLHSLTEAEGYASIAGLINVGGTLYGTASKGGAYSDGTVFSITPAGRMKMLHSFGRGSDGADPQASLVDVSGTLYGTTRHGGAHSCSDSGGTQSCGTVFSITTSGAEKVLYNFSQNDGCYPVANLIEVKGTLYGTTSYCGADGYVGGTVFSLTTAGKERVLHTFDQYTDGYAPEAGLLDVDGTLYGTTAAGGTTGHYGYGTVFALTL